MQPVDPIQAINLIKKNRDNFITYNVACLRELIRYLPSNKFNLFHKIPFLMNINSPNYPGYIKHPEIVYGIYGFEKSGFLEVSLKSYRLTLDQIQPYLSKQPIVLGLYLMGSAGTLAQGIHSDFDYWVVIDNASCTTNQRKRFTEKLHTIESWALNKSNQHVTFFVMDLEQIQNNVYSSLDEESSGTAQKTILKEEFYRTFILVAGKIPFWAVLPVGLSNQDYAQWIHVLTQKDPDQFINQHFIDTGNLTCIDQKECISAILWQVFKARNDPAKSFLKAALICSYYFFQDQERLPCEIIKQRYGDRELDSFLIDPYTVIFEKTLSFFEKLNDIELLELVRECILLRLCGFPLVSMPNTSTPKFNLLETYIKNWQWTSKHINYLIDYPKWFEQEKIDYERKLVLKIAFLYELVVRSHTSKTNDGQDMEHIRLLSHWISRYFQKKEAKIEGCSTYLKTKSSTLSLLISYEHNEHQRKLWSVFDHSLFNVIKQEQLLFIGKEFLVAVGWIIINKLYKKAKSILHFQPNRLNTT
ncbi:MAG: class I adenylate cyclase, partial [Desulfobacterales bacterium]|nr:class I adenylate cyclase [Desulfobacterales bacterium]